MKKESSSADNISEIGLLNWKDFLKTVKNPSTDFGNRMYRLAVTIFFIAFISGLIAGIIAPVYELEMEFGSLKSIGLMTLLFISFWFLFSSIGPYKNR